MVVIACNTATVASIAYLRTRFSIPFVGVVPVVKPACKQTKTGCVAILSTPLTADGSYINDLIQKFGRGVKVLSIGCPGLADLVEAGKVETPEMEALLCNLVAPAMKHNADIIGLCSTHYPFIRDQLQKIVGQSVVILDSNEPVARQVKRVVATLPQSDTTAGRQAQYQFYATADAEKFKAVAQQLVGNTVVCDVQLIDL
jgi:glutamate racemase